MNIESATNASNLLMHHWENGTVIQSLPIDLRPANRKDGYLIQAQIETTSKKPLFGWKIAATSSAGQKHIGIDGPIAGRLLEEMVIHAGEEISLVSNRMRVAEAEFAFRMGKDLPPRIEPYELSEVIDAVSELYLAIEIPDSRYTDFAVVGAPQLIADNACGHRFMLGPEAPVIWRQLDLASHRVVGKVGNRLEREGLGSNVLGDPRIALAWLVNELSTLGITLVSGQIVTTGTCLIPMDVNPGELVSFDFGILGQAACRFSKT